MTTWVGSGPLGAGVPQDLPRTPTSQCRFLQEDPLLPSIFQSRTAGAEDATQRWRREDSSGVYPGIQRSLTKASDYWRCKVAEELPQLPSDLAPASWRLNGGGQRPPPPALRPSLKESPLSQDRILSVEPQQLLQKAHSATFVNNAPAATKPARSWLLQMNPGLQSPSHQAALTKPDEIVPQPSLKDCLGASDADFKQQQLGAREDCLGASDPDLQRQLAQAEQRLECMTTELHLAREEVRCQRRLVFEAKTTGAAHAKALAWCGAELSAARQEVMSEGLAQQLAEAAHAAVQAEAEAAWGHRVKDLECGMEGVKRELHQARLSAEAGELPRLQLLERELRETRAAGEARLEAAGDRIRGLELEVREARASGEAEEASAANEVRSSCEKALLDLCNLHTQQQQEREALYEASVARRDEELTALRTELEEARGSTSSGLQAPSDVERGMLELCELHDLELRRRQEEFQAAMLGRDEELQAALEEQWMSQAALVQRDQDLRAAMLEHHHAQAALSRFSDELHADMETQRRGSEAALSRFSEELHADMATQRRGSEAGPAAAQRPLPEAAAAGARRAVPLGKRATLGRRVQRAGNEADRHSGQAAAAAWPRKPTTDVDDLEADRQSRQVAATDWPRKPTMDVDDVEAPQHESRERCKTEAVEAPQHESRERCKTEAVEAEEDWRRRPTANAAELEADSEVQIVERAPGGDGAG